MTRVPDPVAWTFIVVPMLAPHAVKPTTTAAAIAADINERVIDDRLLKTFNLSELLVRE
jgi:hypothetical protein